MADTQVVVMNFRFQIGIYRRGTIAATRHVDIFLRIAAHAYGQDGEERRPPNGQIDRDAAADVHAWAPIPVSRGGSAINSISTPPMSLG